MKGEKLEPRSGWPNRLERSIATGDFGANLILGWLGLGWLVGGGCFREIFREVSEGSHSFFSVVDAICMSENPKGSEEVREFWTSFNKDLGW